MSNLKSGLAATIVQLAVGAILLGAALPQASAATSPNRSQELEAGKACQDTTIHGLGPHGVFLTGIKRP
jgi:hypothetical protein